MRETNWAGEWTITDHDERLAAEQRELDQAAEMRELERAIADDHRRAEAMRSHGSL